MGSLFSTNSSSSNDNRQAGTDQAIVNRQGNDSTTASGGSLSLGKNAKLNLPGVVDLAGAKDSKIVAGNDFTGTQGNVSITSSDPTVTRDAINALAALSTQFGTSLSDFASQSGAASAASQAATTAALAQNAQTLTSAISNIGQGQQTQVATDSASTATGGVSNYFKPAIIIGLALLALVGFIFWTRK